MGNQPRPTQEQIDKLKAEVAELRAELAEVRELAAAAEGALNALTVVWGVRRLPTPGEVTDEH